MSIDALFERPSYDLPPGEKRALLLDELNALTERHRAGCAPYRRVLEATWSGPSVARRIEEVPFIPVGLFKSHRLVSVPDTQVFKTLTSSGTTGQQVSRILLDKPTARRQGEALARIMTHFLGPKRLPMLIVDSPAVLRDRASFSARGAGIQGMMVFGRQPTFVLDDDMELDEQALARFLEAHGRAPFLMFGFTYMVWEYLYQRVRGRGFDLGQGILIHSGGWKKLMDRAVDNAAFKQRLRDDLGLRRVHNFYGMVEQVGSVFVEGEDGHFLAPNFADVVIRDPESFEPVPQGQVGVVQVLSVLPASYPGHSLLTEDLGVVHGEGSSAPYGTRLKIIGRIPAAELRGCSDTHAFSR